MYLFLNLQTPHRINKTMEKTCQPQSHSQYLLIHSSSRKDSPPQIYFEVNFASLLPFIRKRSPRPHPNQCTYLGLPKQTIFWLCLLRDLKLFQKFVVSSLRIFDVLNFPFFILAAKGQQQFAKSLIRLGSQEEVLS